MQRSEVVREGARREVRAPYAISTSRMRRERYPHGRTWEAHTHLFDHELLWGVSGSVTATVDGVSWTVPPTVGLWVPAGAVHEVTTGPGGDFYTTYFRGEVFTPATERSGVWAGPGLVAVCAALREILLHMRRYGMTLAARNRAEQVAFDLLQPLEIAAVEVPMPTDARALVVARALIADPADPRGLAEFARLSGCGVRTLTRVFTADTGMSFVQWRIQVRVRAALTYLAGGLPVSVVGRRVGYSTPSAFVAVFRRVTGRTPGECFGVVEDSGYADYQGHEDPEGFTDLPDLPDLPGLAGRAAAG
ncbi:helix-turn-helix domain-containing protein [Streptomyces uncialis]|uniref:helix-turn-helix domain-containing protein n=1 Tax=Streptomyces uncialis TaxID=1048205 RepID=UPI0038658D33|nr:AraC family transcriptional regulator [Streptomyces uncialis]